MMKAITPEQATEMRKTVHLRSDSYIDFALAVAMTIGDTLAQDIYCAEIGRRASAELHTLALDAIPTWDQVHNA